MKCRRYEQDHSSFEVETEVCETVAECTVSDEPAIHEVTVTSSKRVPVYVDLTAESVERSVTYLNGEDIDRAEAEDQQEEIGEADKRRDKTVVTGALLPAAEVGDPATRTFRFELKRASEANPRNDTLRVRLRYYLWADEREGYKNDSFPDVHAEVEVA